MSDGSGGPDSGAFDDPLEREYPLLDAVDSRWWYWIAAYPLVNLLFVPLVVIVGVLFLTPVFVVGSGAGGPGMGPGQGAVGLGALVSLVAFVILIVGLVVTLLTLVSVVLLPIALYLDARAVARADLDWEPDPLLYGLLGVVQFVVTPVVGIVVAVYYLYRRHEHVGVP